MINDKLVDMMKATEYRSYSSDTSTDECLELSDKRVECFWSAWPSNTRIAHQGENATNANGKFE